MTNILREQLKGGKIHLVHGFIRPPSRFTQLCAPKQQPPHETLSRKCSHQSTQEAGKKARPHLPKFPEPSNTVPPGGQGMSIKGVFTVRVSQSYKVAKPLRGEGCVGGGGGGQKCAQCCHFLALARLALHRHTSPCVTTSPKRNRTQGLSVSQTLAMVMRREPTQPCWVLASFAGSTVLTDWVPEYKHPAGVVETELQEREGCDCRELWPSVPPCGLQSWVSTGFHTSVGLHLISNHLFPGASALTSLEATLVLSVLSQPLSSLYTGPLQFHLALP